jgi:hypothetical protein
MNDCLLAKWIWKIVNKEDSMWCRLVIRKYMGEKDFFSAKSQGVSVLEGPTQSKTPF